MMPGDLGDVPTLACLNKPQKRALILRDQLRYLEPAHLDTFLDGITTDEPPTYKSVNGAVYPSFAQVTIKEEATRFDLGNVQFPEEGGATYHAYLTVEDGRFEMRTEDALPRDDADLASVAIHRFVAENMFPLFKTKYKAVHARMEKINEARRVAYNMLSHPPAKFEDGKTLSRLTAKPTHIDEPSGSRKRKEITKHVSNKRQRVGLEAIPDAIKSETFNTIPSQIKVDLFNNIIKTAFPNFDNLITASWNVVSVYSNVGSDFPELHKAVVELKGALEEFESAYAPRSKGGKSRKEGTPNQQSGGGGIRTATPVKEGRGTRSPATKANVSTVDQPHDVNDNAGPFPSEGEDEDEDENPARHQMPPPRLPQETPQKKPSPSMEETQLPAPPPPLRPNHSRAHSVPRHPPESHSRHTPTTLHYTSPAPQPSFHSSHASRAPSTDSPAFSPSPSSPYPHQHPLAPGSELMRKRMEYTASLGREREKTKQKSAGAVQAGEEEGEEEEEEEAVEEGLGLGTVRGDEVESGGVAQMGLGNSVLGRKKAGLKVPVADMLGRRETGSGSGGGRGY